MARIRTIKPEFFTSEDICSMSPLGRLFYQACWCEADREGRMEWKPRTMKLRYFPADDCNIEDVAGEVVSRGLVALYEVDGKKYAFIPSFSRHQHVNPREAASVIPGPDATEREQPASQRVTGASLTRADASNLDLPTQVGKERKGREGEGKKARQTDGLTLVPETQRAPEPAPSPDPLGTGLAGVKPDPETGRAICSGWDVKIIFDRCLEAARINPATSRETWETAVGWLNADFEPDDVVAVIKRIVARPNTPPARTLKFFNEAVRAECKPSGWARKLA